MSVVLGIDGGGTNTRAALLSDGKLIASGQSGSIKRLRVGAEVAEANLRALLTDVCLKSGIKRVDAACCGVASATMPGITEWITAVFDDFGVQRSEVVGDEVIALDAAFHGGPGILQIAGTGTNTIGRAADGSRELPAGGVHASATKDRATGSGCIRCAAPSMPTIAKSRRAFSTELAKSGVRRPSMS